MTGGVTRTGGALAKIADPKAAEAAGGYLDDEDPLVRWHAVQLMINAEFRELSGKLEQMAAGDVNEMVKEAAEIALGKLNPLPPNLNN